VIFLCHGTPVSDVEYFQETAENGGTRAAKSAETEARLADDE
jgi:hypothetical protein